MISIPLYIFLFIYLFLLCGWAVFFFINLTHLIHTGTITFASTAVTLMVLGGSILVFLVTIFLLRNVSWQTPVVLWNADWIHSASSPTGF